MASARLVAQLLAGWCHWEPLHFDHLIIQNGHSMVSLARITTYSSLTKHRSTHLDPVNVSGGQLALSLPGNLPVGAIPVEPFPN
jgi:hypothetical protein